MRTSIAIAIALTIGACALPKSTQYSSLTQTVPLDCADNLYAGLPCEVLPLHDDFAAHVQHGMQPNSPITRALR